jgi:hypothetical protein
VKKYKYVSKEAEKLNRAIVKNNKSNAIISWHRILFENKIVIFKTKWLAITKVTNNMIFNCLDMMSNVRHQ